MPGIPYQLDELYDQECMKTERLEMGLHELGAQMELLQSLIEDYDGIIVSNTHERSEARGRVIANAEESVALFRRHFKEYG